MPATAQTSAPISSGPAASGPSATASSPSLAATTGQSLATAPISSTTSQPGSSAASSSSTSPSLAPAPISGAPPRPDSSAATSAARGTAASPSLAAHNSASQPEVRLVNRQVPVAAEPEVKLFAPEGSAEGCASGECLPPAPDLHEADEPEPPAPVPAATARGPSTDDEKWRRAVDALREVSPRHGKSLSYARFLGFTPEGVRLAFPPDAAFHKSQVTGMSRPMVEGELTRALGRPIKLVEDSSVQALESAPKSIAEVEATDQSSRERGIEGKVKAHPALRNVLRHLGGALEHIAYLEPAAVIRPSAPSPDEGDAGPTVD